MSSLASAVSFAVNLLLFALAGLASMQVGLPRSNCVVEPSAADVLPLEISRAAVVAALGCDGELLSRRELGAELIAEAVGWRINVWPYGRLDGTFYNGVIHAKAATKLSLRLAD
jgi:hypothetical protein